MHFDGTPERKGNSGRIPDSKRDDHKLYQHLQITLPPDIYARLKAFCDEEERAASWTIAKALDMWLSGKGY